MLGPYHRGDQVEVHVWNGERHVPAGTFVVTDARCAEPRGEAKFFRVYQTTYERAS